MIIFSIICVLEISLRCFFGFCDAPLSIESPEYEYIFAPSQIRNRFGNLIKYNSYSQRSEEPDSTKIIILGLGDSVINGGVQTDQKELATELASDSIYQILNISAGSWGPDNCAAYIKKFGSFRAQKILLVVSSHDAHNIMTFEPVVGQSSSFPKAQYRSAIYELLDRYVIPRIIKHRKKFDPDKAVNDGINITKGYGKFNPGFTELKQIADSLKIEMEIYLHPDKLECKNNKFNSQGQEIINWANENNVILTSGLDMGENEFSFRDNIHLNTTGQKILGNWLYQAARR